jgi:Ala-tRNA(Pro) deacylase
MAMTSDELLDYLRECGITATTFEHPPVHTVEESRLLRGDIAGIHTKNLFLQDSKKVLFLLVANEETKISLKEIRNKIGARRSLSFASSSTLQAVLGIEPGTVSLLALINDPEHRVTVAIDESLLKGGPINCHPLTNTRTTSLSASGVRAFLACTGHTTIFISLAQDDGDQS